jgi:hypothetical protein
MHYTGYLCLLALGLKNCWVHTIINDNSIPASIHTTAFMTRLMTNTPRELKLNDASQYPANKIEDGQMNINHVGQAYKPSRIGTSKAHPKTLDGRSVSSIMANEQARKGKGARVRDR